MLVHSTRSIHHAEDKKYIKDYVINKKNFAYCTGTWSGTFSILLVSKIAS